MWLLLPTRKTPPRGLPKKGKWQEGSLLSFSFSWGGGGGLWKAKREGLTFLKDKIFLGK